MRGSSTFGTAKFCDPLLTSAAIQQFWDPLLFLHVEDSDCKFGVQLGLRKYHTQTTFWTKNGVGVGTVG